MTHLLAARARSEASTSFQEGADVDFNPCLLLTLLSVLEAWDLILLSLFTHL